MKLTESTDTYTSDKVTCTIVVNVKETFTGNEGFPQTNGLQLENKRSIAWQIQYLVRKEQTSVTLSPLLETLGPMVRKVDVKKFYNPS